MSRNTIIEEDICKVYEHIDLSELVDKEILITGASGLIGTYFLFSIKKFIDLGNSIKKLYIVINSNIPEHLYEFANYSWIEVLKGDLADDIFCTQLPQVDYIIHGAGYAQPGRFLANPDKTIKLNTSTTFHLLDRLKLEGKFLFISSSEVYSGNSNIPYKETDIGTTNTLHDRACYIEGKRCGEAICNAYRSKGINVKSARLSLAYGPGTRKGDKRALNMFIEKAIEGEIKLFDRGTANRTYCYVSDAVELMWNILLFGSEPIYNVGGHSHTTILELAEMIGEKLDVPVILPDVDKNLTGAPLDVYVDMSKAEKEFSKNEYVTLNEGITRTIKWNQFLL